MPIEIDVAYLQGCGIINTPTYWIENSVKGKTVDGENAGFLIAKMADYLRKKG